MSKSTSSVSLGAFLILLLTQQVQSFQIHGSMIALTRLDPIVNPGALSSHSHMIIGGSNFGPSLTSAHLEKSSCSSLETQQDKSAYWVSPPYGQNKNGSWNALPVTSVSIYYKKVNNEPIVPFPPDFRMLIGNPSATAKNYQDPFMSFQCQNFIPEGDPTGAWNFSSGWERLPTMDCSRIKLATTFPNCWDGVNSDSPNHRDHVHNDVGGGTECPPSHPKRIAQITLEIDFWSHDYAWQDISLSSGSKSGWGIHADYFFGWADSGAVLNKALADPTCIEAQGIESFYPADQRCETLVPYANETAANICASSLLSLIAQEEVGITRPIPELPGCNPRFDAPGYPATKPACDRTIPAVSIGLPKRIFPWSDQDPRHVDFPRGLAIWDEGIPVPIPSTPTPVHQQSAPGGYKFLGCYTELQNARALSEARFDNSFMTISKCAASCSAYLYFGVEYGTECFCGNTLGSGSTLAPVGGCNLVCPGDKGAFCGAAGRFELFWRGGATSSSTSSSATSSVVTTKQSTTTATTLTTTTKATTTTKLTTTTTTTTTKSTTKSTTTTPSPTPTGPASGTIYLTQGQNWDGFAQEWTWARGVCKVLTSSFAKNLGSAGPNVGFCTFYDDVNCKGNVLFEMSFPGRSQLGAIGKKVLAFSCK